MPSFRLITNTHSPLTFFIIRLLLGFICSGVRIEPFSSIISARSMMLRASIAPVPQIPIGVLLLIISLIILYLFLLTRFIPPGMEAQPQLRPMPSRDGVDSEQVSIALRLPKIIAVFTPISISSTGVSLLYSPQVSIDATVSAPFQPEITPGSSTIASGAYFNPRLLPVNCRASFVKG